MRPWRRQNQLKREYDFDFPLSFTFTLQRLYEAGDPIFGPFARFLADRSASPDLQTARVFLVFDPSHWTEDCLQDLDDAELGLDPLVVHPIHLSNLAQLTERLFSGLGSWTS